MISYGNTESLLSSMGIKTRLTGDHYVVLCPFHDDSNPSLYINRDTGFWDCKSCLAKGDIVDYYKKMTGESFQQAKKSLGLETEKPPKPSVNYLKSRGIKKEFADLFGLIERDTFLEIPLNDTHFIKRLYKPITKPKKIKYLNPEGFKISHCLYGLQQALPYIQKYNRVIVTEGPLDVIACHQLGHPYAVSTLGCSLSNEQAAQLRELSCTIVLAYDFDEAGINGSAKAKRLINFKSLQFPKGISDPADFLTNTNHQLKFESIIDRALTPSFIPLQLASKDEKCKLLATESNLLTVFKYHPALRDAGLHYDEGKNDISFLNGIDCRKLAIRIEPGTKISDEHYVYIQKIIAHQAAEYLPYDYAANFPVTTIARGMRAYAMAHRTDSLKREVMVMATEKVLSIPLSEVLIQYFNAEDTSSCRLISQYFFRQMVKRALNPGCQADYMLILEGEQGTGKSQAIRSLAGNWYGSVQRKFDENAIRAVRSSWVVEFPELSVFKGSSIETLKDFITRMDDRLTPKYIECEQIYPRRCVFIGNTNKDEYLNDPTGHRRFWPVKIKGQIDVDKIERDRARIIATAYRELMDSQRSFPTPSEFRIINKSTASRQEMMPYEDNIIQWMSSHPSDTEKMTATEAYGEMVSKSMVPTQSEIIKLGSTLRALGWVQHREGNKRLWQRPQVQLKAECEDEL